MSLVNNMVLVKKSLQMDSSRARKNMLERITNSLRQKNLIPFPSDDCIQPIFVDDQEDLVSTFSTAFIKLEGRIIRCSNTQELILKLKGLIEQKKLVNVTCRTNSLLKAFQLGLLPIVNNDATSEADAAITDCEFLVARTGTVVLSAAQQSGRILPVYAPVHIVIAYQHQLIRHIGDAIDSLKRKYSDRLPSAVFFASGPSRTGDIERTLVVGVHGPKEVYVFLVNSEF